MTLSPSGDVLVFSAVGGDGVAHLFARRLEERDAARMEGTEGAVDPAFSPDGDWVAFWSDGELRKVKRGGGLPVALCKAPLTFGISWGAERNYRVRGRTKRIVECRIVRRRGQDSHKSRV